MTVAVDQIVFIGPVCTGKTTLLRLVADRVGAEAVDLDEVANHYYEEVARGTTPYKRKAARSAFSPHTVGGRRRIRTRFVVSSKTTHTP